MENGHKGYEVKVTDTAWQQLLKHAQFLANVSVSAAEQLVEDFIESTRTLSQMPERCPWLVHDAIPFQKYRKLLIGKYHMALFQVRGNVVYITAALDCRQDYGWLLYEPE